MRGITDQHLDVSFDDGDVLAAARRDPIGFVSSLSPKSILDEVQRAPEIFPSLKSVIDNRRTAGRFILTGSANVLLVPRLAGSLAGRIGILRLHPLAQCEIESSQPRFIDTLFAGRFKTRIGERLGTNLLERIVAGGYPAALARRAAARQAAWYRDYIETQIQRDVRDLSRIHSLDALPKLLTAAASHTGTLLNVADLAAPLELTRQTIHDYITLLERVFLVERLPAWHANRLSRLVKRPKLHVGDTGITCALLGIDTTGLARDGSTFGSMLETFVLQELRRQASGRPASVNFFHLRDRDDFEVDIVLEHGHSAVARRRSESGGKRERERLARTPQAEKYRRQALHDGYRPLRRNCDHPLRRRLVCRADPFPLGDVMTDFIERRKLIVESVREI